MIIRVPSFVHVALFSIVLGVGLAGCDKPGNSAASSQNNRRPANLVSVGGYVGGEKMLFLQNPELVLILAEKHGIRVDATKAGSVEMVATLTAAGKDFLWPSNDIAVEFFRMAGGHQKKAEIIFNSPIVIYTGWDIAGALIREGIVEKRTEGYYIVQFKALLDMITQGRKWKDLGLNFYGSLSVRCTDPTKSNSGNMFAGLVANMMNNGDVVDEQSVESLLPQIREFFGRLGMMEHSSGDIFQKFITTGIRNSMVVGYENQAIEFILANPQHRDLIVNSVCVLYPTPTVWSSHPVISLTDSGNRLIDALLDPEIQALAWRDHGFRSGLVGVTTDPSVINMPFMPDHIDSVMPLPKARAMQRIVDTLHGL